MKLNFETYRKKVYGCFIGKNIGGTIGTPYESKREMQDIEGFVTKPGEVLPNDDLDLQLVWLKAVEDTGSLGLDSKRLGEFWISYITPHWNEYGISKKNMKAGLLPPLSGDAFNSWRDSNGAWIRTEIWAALAPACPDVALKYAFEDASVDHGMGEGTTAAVFVAAMESAAYVISDIRTLINIGLSKIPETSRVAMSIRLLLDCYDKGIGYRQTREIIRESNSDIGDGWFEAPSNVAYAMLGLLYGEGDFKKSVIYATNCGDDTDCTAATVGAILGIIGGIEGIPVDWRAYLGDNIVTVSIACGVMARVPKTCTELTDRVVKAAPMVLLENRADVSFTDGEAEMPDGLYELFSGNEVSGELLARPAYSFTHEMGFATATVTHEGDPKIAPCETRKLTVSFKNNWKVYGNSPFFMRLNWILPDGFSVKGTKSLTLNAYNAHSLDCSATVEFEITAGEYTESSNRLVLEVETDGRPTVAYIPVVFVG